RRRRRGGAGRHHLFPPLPIRWRIVSQFWLRQPVDRRPAREARNPFVMNEDIAATTARTRRDGFAFSHFASGAAEIRRTAFANATICVQSFRLNVAVQRGSISACVRARAGAARRAASISSAQWNEAASHAYV